MVKGSKLKIKIIQERGMEKKKKNFAGAGACQLLCLRPCFSTLVNILSNFLAIKYIYLVIENR